MRRGIALALCVVAALTMSAGCSGSSDTKSASVQVTGQVEIAATGGPWRAVTDNRTIRVGDQVKVTQGTAEVTLSDDRRLGLRPGSHMTLALGADGTDLRPDLVAGDLLVEVPDGSLSVSTSDTSVGITGGTARISRNSSVVVGSYSAAVLLDSTGRTMQIQPLRQAAVPAAGEIDGPSPLVYSDSDSWDRRFLSGVIQLGNQLVARSRGFTAQLRQGEGDDPGFLPQLLPALAAEPSFDPSLDDPSRSPGERLVGLAITLAGTRGTFVDRWTAVTAFHGQGADWGLVALDQGVSGVALLADIDAAIGRGPSLLPQPQAPAPPTQTTAPPAVSVSGSESVPPETGSPEPEPSAPSEQSAAPSATPGPLNTGVGVLDETTNSLVNVLSGLLNSLGR